MSCFLLLSAKEKQIQRIRSIFRRQLSVPLVDMQSTLLAYEAWEVEQGDVQAAESRDLDVISSHVASAYKRTLEINNARVQFEEKIASQDISDTGRVQLYMSYFKLEQSSGTPPRVQVVYECAITELPLSSDLWLDYAQYLDRTLKVGNIVSSTYSRAPKNCPWVGELWVRYLLSLEHCHASEKEIAAYWDLFLTCVDGLRRRISSTGDLEDLLDYQLIRETFQGLAYVDFSDEAHLAGAVAKSKQMLLGKKVSIARSNPKHSKKESSDSRTSKKHFHATDQSGAAGGSASRESDDNSQEASLEPHSAIIKSGGDNVQLKGRNTFAIPRNVRPLGVRQIHQKLRREMKSQNPMMSSERCSLRNRFFLTQPQMAIIFLTFSC
ncbi:Squamous cell carcinoma antigen recognized by T-cells 3 like [Quillaja saponaria]|uniref:Squamous cell carcinoma antigen recognized by T-cells 3 like n=1 Tax=Quillaja saponaria TaxID=32244 RepID=A0AAD7P9E3_QUISA|nr:Squamous cell carcinoma antigen recognized by T-cells 3 like [Quillaja saponaria]